MVKSATEENKVGVGTAVFKGMTREDAIEKVSCGQRLGVGKSIPGRGNCKCKCPEAGTC